MSGRILQAPRLLRRYPFGVFCALFLVLAIFPATSPSQDGKVSRKLLRQIGVMEKIFCQVLVDSPNFLVANRGAVRGTYLEEFGVLLTFEASLVGKDSWDDYNWRGAYRVERDKSGRTVIILPEDEDEDDWDEDDRDEDKRDSHKGADDREQDDEGTEDHGADDHGDDEYRHDGDDRKYRQKSRVESGQARSGRSWNSRQRRTEQRLYSRGKVELQDALVDYGDTLTKLRDDQSVAIASLLRDSSFFIDEKISRLIMKVKMKDLRAYASGKIDEEELRTRIVEEEY